MTSPAFAQNSYNCPCKHEQAPAYLAVVWRQSVRANLLLNDSSCAPDDEQAIRKVLAMAVLYSHHPRSHQGGLELKPLQDV